MEQVRVRFAPSPTGELHIGGVRTALFNWLYTRNKGGRFILRIDDTDKQRSSEAHLESILKSFQWLGLNWDEGPGYGGDYGPYRQSERLATYLHEIEKLQTNGKAYTCFCTAEELEIEREKCRQLGQPPRYSGHCRDLSAEEVEARKNKGNKYVIRAVTPVEGKTVVEDLIRGSVTFENKVFDDPIIIKSDGLPTYNFASVVDDFKMKITHVIRAEEHLSNTPRQQMIALQLGYTVPHFAHVPMILAPDHSKLSKRHGATSVQEYRDLGILPEALLNYLALLGWSPGEDREIMKMDEMISLFSLERVSKNPAIYDLQKLTWLNGYYLRTGDLQRITKMAIPFLQNEGIVSADLSPEQEKEIADIVKLVREKVRTLAEITDASRFFFKDDFDYDPKGVAKHFNKEGSLNRLQHVQDTLEKTEPFTAEQIEKSFTQLAADLDVSLNKINPLTRLAVTGRMMGPELYPTLALLGRETVTQRLKHAQQYIVNNK